MANYKEYEYHTSVYYEDTDCSGFVYHTSYIRFAERARFEMMQLISPELTRKLLESEFLFVVSELSINYFKPLKFQDKIKILTKIINYSRCSIKLQQDITSNYVLNAKINLKLVWINSKSGKPSRIPSDLISRFNLLKIV